MSGDYLRPAFGEPVSDWFRWFAWRPVETADRGLRWLCPLWRRRIQKHDYLFGGADFWFQHAVKSTPAQPTAPTEGTTESEAAL